MTGPDTSEVHGMAEHRPTEQYSLDGDPRVAIFERTDRVVRAAIEIDNLAVVVGELLAQPSARPADFFASRSDHLVLHTVIAIDDKDEYVILDSEPTNGEMPWLSAVTPAFFDEECELFEQFGLLPPAGHWLNRLAVAPPRGGGEATQHGHAMPSRDTHLPHTVEGPAFEFPVGPVRGAGVESLYYGLVTSGEEVIDLFLQSWHKYRGIQRRLTGMPPERATFFVERSEGLSAASMATAYCGAVEDALGRHPNCTVQRDRAICIELERLYNHAQCLAALAQATGLFVGQAQAEIIIERLLRLNLEVSGHRYLLNAIGVGHGRTLNIEPLHRELDSAADELRRVIDAVLSTNSCVDRLEACGVLALDDVRSLGLVGPIARAAGLHIDVRADHPSFGSRIGQIASRTDGDCLARIVVRRDEIESSVEFLHALADGDIAPRANPATEPRGWGLGAAESPRGEVLVWVEATADRLGPVRLRTASARCWRGFDDAVRSQNVFTDVPIIEASFWLTAAGRTP